MPLEDLEGAAAQGRRAGGLGHVGAVGAGLAGQLVDQRGQFGAHLAVGGLAGQVDAVLLLEGLLQQRYQQDVLAGTRELRGRRRAERSAAGKKAARVLALSTITEQYLMASCATPVWCEARKASMLGTGGSCCCTCR